MLAARQQSNLWDKTGKDIVQVGLLSNVVLLLFLLFLISIIIAKLDGTIVKAIVERKQVAALFFLPLIPSPQLSLSLLHIRQPHLSLSLAQVNTRDDDAG